MTLMRNCGCNPELPFPGTMIQKSELMLILRLLKYRSSKKEWLQQVIADFDAYNKCKCESCHVIIGVDPPLMKHCLCCSPECNNRLPHDESTEACIARSPGTSLVTRLNVAVQTVVPEVEWLEDFICLPIFQQLKLILICIKQLLLRKQHLFGSLTHTEHIMYCRVFVVMRYLCKNEQELHGKPVHESTCLQSESVDRDGQLLCFGRYFRHLTASHSNTSAVLHHFIPEVLLEALSCLLQKTGERALHEAISCTSEVSINYWTCDHRYKLCLYKSDGCRIAFYRRMRAESSTFDTWEQSSLLNCFEKVQQSDTRTTGESPLPDSTEIICDVLAPPWLGMLHKYYRQMSDLEQFMDESDVAPTDWSAHTTEDLHTMYRAWSLSNCNKELIKYLVRALRHYISIEREMREMCLMFVNASCVQENALKNLEHVPVNLWPQRVVKLVCDQCRQRTPDQQRPYHYMTDNGKQSSLSSTGKLQQHLSESDQQGIKTPAFSRQNRCSEKPKLSSKAASSMSIQMPLKTELHLVCQFSGHSVLGQMSRSPGSNPSRLRGGSSEKMLSSPSRNRSLGEVRSSSSQSRSSLKSFVRERSSSLLSGEIRSTSDENGSSLSSSSASSATHLSPSGSLKHRRSHSGHGCIIRSYSRAVNKHRARYRSSKQRSLVKEYKSSAYDNLSSGEITSSSNENESSSISEVSTGSSSSSSSSTLSYHEHASSCHSAKHKRLCSISQQRITLVHQHSDSRSLKEHCKRKEVSERHLAGNLSCDRTILKRRSHTETGDELQQVKSLSSRRNSLLCDSECRHWCSRERDSKNGATVLVSDHPGNSRSAAKRNHGSRKMVKRFLVKINTKMELDATDSFACSAKNSDFTGCISQLGIASSYLGTKESLEFGHLWQSSISERGDWQSSAMVEEPLVPPTAADNQAFGDDAAVLDASEERAMTSDPENRKAERFAKKKLLQKYSHHSTALRRVKELQPCIACHHVMAKAVTSSCGSYSGKNKTAALQKYADFGRSRHVSGRQFCHQCCRVMKSQSLGISRRKAQMECRPSGSEGRNRSCNEAMITEDCLSTDGLSASHPTAAKSPTDSCTTALKHSNDLQASYSWSEAETCKVGDKSSGNWFYECKVASSSLQSSSNNNEQGKDVLSALMRHSSQISFENAMSVEDTCQASTLVENSTQEPVEHVDPGDCHLKLDEPCMERVFSHVVPAEHLMQPVEGSFQTPDRNLYSSILGQHLEEFTVEERSPVQSSWAPGIPGQPITNDAEPETSCQEPMTTLDGMEEPGSELVHQSVGWLANSRKPVKAGDVDNGSSVVDDGDVERCGEDVGDESLQHDGNGEMEQEDDVNAMICDGQEQCFQRSEQVSSMQVEADDVAGKANHIASEANGTAVAVSSNTEDASDIVAETVDTTAECSNMMAECSDRTAGLSHVMTESRDRTLAPDEWYTTVIERDGTPSGDEGGRNLLVSSNVRSQHTQPELGIQHLGRQINLPEITEPSLCFNDSSFMATFSDSDDEDESDLPAVLMTRSSQSESVPEHDQQAANTTQENQNKEANPVQVLPSGDGERKMADLRMMLDFMLTEKICKLEDNRKLAAQVDELNEDLRKGGITKFSLEDLTEVEETELLPEHKAKLKQFEIQNCQISGEAPGLHLFDCTKVHHLFSFPTTLTLSLCGFVPGRSSLDKMLATADPDCISELLNSQMIQMCFESLSSPDVFMDWLFFLLSDVTGELLSSSSLKTLLDLLQREHGKSSHWIPTPLTLARVFVNYGASLSMLLPVDDLVDFTDSDLSLTNNKENSQPDNNPVTGQMLPPTGQWCYFDGLRRVLRVLAEAIHKRRHLYSVKDLLAITVMLFRVSIDQNLNNNCLMHDLKLCISAILNAIPHEKWYSYISQLCQFAPQLASHHHNLLQLVEVLPPSERGITLQHHLAYVFLHYLSFGSCDQDFMDLKIRDLLPIVKSFQVGEGTDFYRLYSLCVLLDRCISKKTLPVSEKDHLKVLCDMLKCLMGSVRECITDLDRSVVKELLTQLISILSIKLESMGFRQRTMFEYCLPPSEERPSLAVDQTQDDQSEDDSILGSQSEVSRSCE